MSVVVGEDNRTWVLNSITGRSYELLQDCPPLEYSRDVNSGLTITVDEGRLFDLVYLRHLEVNDDHRDFKAVVADSMWSEFLALKNSGDLYYGSITDITEDNIPIAELTQVDKDVDYVVRGSRFNDMIAIKGKKVIVYESESNGYSVTREWNLYNNEDIEAIYPRVIVTDRRFLVVRRTDIIEVERRGTVIGCGIIDQCGVDRLITAENVNGELLVRLDDTVVNITKKDDWIDMISIVDVPYLLNKSGNLYDVITDRYIEIIPAHILTR